MFTVRVETGFRASHRLALPDNSKEPLHRHDWRVAVDVSGDKVNRMGLVIDFHKLKSMVETVTGPLDGIVLETVDYFVRNNSSAENVARYIYEELEPDLPKGVKLEAVRVLEEPGCSAKFANK